MNLAYIGIALFPFRIAGDKTFTLNLVSKLKDKNEVVVISINDYLKEYENADGVHYYYLKRPFHKNVFYKYAFIKDEKIISFHHIHNALWQFIELTFTILWNIRKIKNIVQKHEVQILHVLDNLGLGNYLLVSLLGKIKVVITIYRYQKKNALYRLYLKYSIRLFKYIIYTTEATKNLFSIENISKSKGFVIPWATFGSRRIENSSGEQKKKYNLIWAGFIQQINEDDFNYALKIARALADYDIINSITFIFKPESYKSKYSGDYGKKIKVLHQNYNFDETLNMQDVLFCPISPTKVASTFAPPLTWIECWSKGIPIITSEFIGHDELIKSNCNGWAVRESEEKEFVRQVIGILANMDGGEKKRCITNFNARFNLEDVVKLYQKTYEDIINDNY